MKYLVRWNYQGRLCEAFLHDRETAKTVLQAIAAFYSGDGIKVQLWQWATLESEIKS